MQPKLQQLDLFGGPAQDIGGVKEKKKAKTKATPEVTSTEETPVPTSHSTVVSTPAPAIEDPEVISAIYEAPFVTESVAVEASFVEPSYVEPTYVEPAYVEPAYVERPRQPRVTIEKIAGKRAVSYTHLTLPTKRIV